MTANPNDLDVLSHPEIKKGDPSLNTDIIARVFDIKVQKLKRMLKGEKILGNVRNIISVTEFQKRGLPHVHMVVTTDHKVDFVNCFFFVLFCLRIFYV